MFAVVWPKDFPRETFKRRSRPKHFTRIEFEVARKLRHRVSPVNINYLSKHCVKRRARYFKFGAFQHRKPNARVLLSLHRLSHEVCSLINDRSSVLPYASLGLRSLTHSLAIVKSGKRETGNVSRRGGQNLLVWRNGQSWLLVARPSNAERPANSRMEKRTSNRIETCPLPPCNSAGFNVARIDAPRTTVSYLCPATLPWFVRTHTRTS